jgi:nucleotide-binding universal stress UspA family protein
VRRYLVVANQTLGGEELWAAIRERMAGGDCHFHLVVPATPASQLDPVLGPASGETGDQGGDARSELKEARQLLEDELDDVDTRESGEDQGRRLARQRMRQQLDRMRELGASVSGEIGVADPVDAVRVVLHRWEFDEVILSTLPGRRSRWLAADLPTKLRRGFKLPVTQITGTTTAKG